MAELPSDPYLSLPDRPQGAFLRGELQRRGLGERDAHRLEWAYRTYALPHEMLRVEMLRLTYLCDPRWYDGSTRFRPTVVKDYFERLIKPIVHAHHDSEEQLWFPEMQKRLQLAPKLATDHATLMRNLDDVSSRLAELEAAVSRGAGEEPVKAAARQLHDTVVAMGAMFEEHLLEEDALAPQMQQHLDEEWERGMIERQVRFARRSHPAEIVSMEFAAIVMAMRKWG